MWFLVGQERNAGLRIWLKPGMTLTVGRQNADDILSLGNGDISVGRRHATLTVSKPTMQSVRVRDDLTTLTICDLSSKHGVFVDNQRIEAAQNFEVAIDADHTWKKQERRHVAGRGYGGFVNVTIGEKTSFRLERVDWSICTQGLNALAKVGLLETAAEIDFKVEEAWAPGVSTHLVVAKPNRSEKLYLALAEGGYLVDVGWLKAVEKSCKDSWDSKGQMDARSMEISHPAPVPSAYENANIQWTPNPFRRTLFNNYRFISVTASKYPTLGQVIQCAGGSWIRVEASAALKLINECMVATVMPVFLYPSGTSHPATAFPTIDAILKRMKYRWVQEDEIGMAIMYTSADEYCNPKYMDALPTVEVMATLHNSLYSASLVLGSFGDGSMTTATPNLSRNGSDIHHTKDSPHVIEDDDPSSASFSLSMMLPSSRKTNHKANDSHTPTTGNEKITSQVEKPADTEKPAAVERPAKKKAKTDRMAFFFDGLDDEDDDVIAVDPVEPKSQVHLSADIVPGTLLTPGILEVSQGMPNSFQPIPTVSPSSTKTSATTKIPSVSRESSKDTLVTRDTPEEMDLEPVKKDTKGPGKQSSKESGATTRGTPERLEPVKKGVKGSGGKQSSKGSTTTKDVPGQVDPGPVEKTVESSQPEDPLKDVAVIIDEPELPSKASVKKKPSAFDAIREDMVTLNLDIKVGRQKQSLDEQERSRRFEALKLQKTKNEGEKLMQSEWSERLLKNKRAKLEEEDDQSDNHSTTSHRSVQSVSERDWPEHWKTMSNFKNAVKVDPVLQEKWKDRPNFKAFRKAVRVGTEVESRRSMSLAPGGALAMKQEELAQKIGSYLKREKPQETPTTRRKAVNEKQMAKDDLKALFAEK